MEFFIEAYSCHIEEIFPKQPNPQIKTKMTGYVFIERAAKKVQSIRRPPIYRVVYLEQKCRRALFVFVSPTVSSAPATIFMPSGPMQQPGST